MQLGALSALKELDVGGNARIATFPNELCECLSDVDAENAHPLICKPAGATADATRERQRRNCATATVACYSTFRTRATAQVDVFRPEQTRTHARTRAHTCDARARTHTLTPTHGSSRRRRASALADAAATAPCATLRPKLETLCLNNTAIAAVLSLPYHLCLFVFLFVCFEPADRWPVRRSPPVPVQIGGCHRLLHVAT